MIVETAWYSVGWPGTDCHRCASYSRWGADLPAAGGGAEAGAQHQGSCAGRNQPEKKADRWGWGGELCGQPDCLLCKLGVKGGCHRRAGVLYKGTCNIRENANIVAIL